MAEPSVTTVTAVDPLTLKQPVSTPEATVAGIEQRTIERGEKPPFVPVSPGEDDYRRPPFAILGTPENEQAFANIVDNSNPKGASLRRQINFALGDKANFDKKSKDHLEIGRLAAQSPFSVGVNPSAQPIIHPKTEFLANFGKSDKEVITNIASAQLRASHYANRYDQDGIAKLIDQDDSLLESPEGLADAMRTVGMFKTKEEEAFFRDGANNKYSNEFLTSPFRLIQQKYMEKFKGTMHPSQLENHLADGFRLNPDNPNHVKMFRQYEAWIENHPDQSSSFAKNVGGVISMLTEAVVDTGWGLVASTGSPQIDWNPKFTDEARKAEYTDKILKLISAKKNGEILKNFTETGAMEMIEKDFKVDGSVKWDYLDESTRREIPTIILEIARETKALNDAGAFSAKSRLFTSTLTSLSAVVTGTTGMLGMGIVKRPDNWWGMTVSGFWSASDTFGGYLTANDAYGLDDSGKKKIPFRDGNFMIQFEREQMLRMNTASDFETFHHHLASEGIFPKLEGGRTVVDTRYHEGMSMFMTAAEGVGVFKLATAGTRNALKFGAMRAGASRSFMESTGLQASKEAMMTQVRKLAQAGGKIDFVEADAALGDLLNKTVRDAAAENAGKGIDEYEAIRRIYNNEVRMADPKNPGKFIAVPQEMLQRLSDMVASKAGQVQTIRDAIVGAAREGKKIVYSEQAMNTLEKARAHLKAKYPDIDWAGQTDNVIYDRIRRGDVKTGTAVGEITENELRSMQKEVGKSWRRIDLEDIAGFKRGQSLPIASKWLTDNFMWDYGIGALKSSGKLGDWVNKLSDTYGVPRGSVSAMTRLNGTKAVTAATLNETGNQGFARVAMINLVIPTLKLIGAVGDTAEFYQEFLQANQLELGHDYGSTLLGMQSKYNRQLRDILIKRAAIKPSDWAAVTEELQALGETVVKDPPQQITTSVNVEREIERLTAEYNRTMAKAEWADRLHTAFANGGGAGTVKVFGDGMVSSVTNEAFFSTFQGLSGFGNGTGFALFGTGTNALTSGWSTHFIKNKKLQERTGNDLRELRGRLADMGGDIQGDIQRMKWNDILNSAKDKSEVLRRTHGHEAADTYYAKEVFTMANLFRSGAKVVLTDAHVRIGMIKVMESLQMQDPAFADKMRNHYLEIADQQGMKGEAAVKYADQMIGQLALNNAAQVRRGTLTKESETLNAQLQKLLEGPGKEADQLHQAAIQLAKDAGMNPDDFFFTTTGEVSSGIDTSAMPKDIKARIDTLMQETSRLRQIQIKNHQEGDTINKRLSEIADEMGKLPKGDEIAPYRDGQITFGIDGSTWTSWKNGITVFERNGERVIYLDQDNFKRRDAQEETIHAIWHTENMADSQAYLRNMIFGEYTVNESGQRVLKKAPLIGKDVAESIEMVDFFIKAHAETLSDGDKAFFLARWEQGKKNQAKNPDDIRLLHLGLMEFGAKLYQARMELANPSFGRGPQQGSSMDGSMEQGNIPIKQGTNTASGLYETWFFGPNANLGSKMKQNARLLYKLAMGDLTLEDLANDGNPINAVDVDWTGKKGNLLTEKLRKAAKIMEYFGVGGKLDGRWKAGLDGRLDEMGFVMDENGFYKSGQIRNPITGELNPIDPVAARWADQMIAHTRNRGGKTNVASLFDFESVSQNEGVNTPEAQRQRWQWAFASGRAHFINPKTGAFKKSLSEMLDYEWEPLGSLIDRVVDDGALYGLSVKKTVDGRTVLIGTPNVQQTKKILEHLKTEYSKFSGGNQQTMENIAILMQAIADGNRFDPNAPKESAGWTQTFVGEYEGATQTTGVGTPKRTRNTTPQQRLFAPMRLVIRASSLDAEGRKNEGGEAVNQMYVEVYDIIAGNKAKLNAWNNLLFQENGEPYWKSASEIRGLFGDKLGNLQTAMDLVLTNYQNGGDITRKTGPTAIRPPQESWEVLLDMAGGNSGTAKLMAAAVNRILGSTQTDFVELNGLEQLEVKKMSKLSASQRARREELREKFDPENEDKNGRTPLDSVTSAERKAALLYGLNPNPLGRSPMRDAQSPFGLFRFDRFIGSVAPHIGEHGPVKTRLNQFSQPLINANYASQNWAPMAPKDLTANTSLYNLGDEKVTEGYLHPSGYAAYKMVNTRKKGAGEEVIEDYILFDPTRGLAGRGFKTKEAALDFAEQHSQSITLPPASANKIELALKKEGWSPSGIDFAGRIRTKFVSDDGKWVADRTHSRGRSGYLLTHVESGLQIGGPIRIGMQVDRQTPNVKDLNAAVKAAEEGGTVQLMLSAKYEAKIKQTPQLADWYVIQGDPKNKKVFFAAKNPVYYEFRQRFAETLGWAEVNQITEMMRKELGDEVVATDHNAVCNWVEAWTAAWSQDALKDMADVAQVRGVMEGRMDKLKMHQERVQIDRINQGQLRSWAKPRQPAPFKEAPPLPFGATPEQQAQRQKETAERKSEWDEKIKQFTEESIRWEANKAAFDLKPIEEGKVKWLVEYSRELKRRQQEFAALSATLGGVTQAGANTALGETVVNNLTLIRNNVKAAVNVAESIWYVDNQGYIIQQLMYRRPTNVFGIEINHKKVLTQGYKEGEVRDANYIIYGLGGNIIARAKTREEAADAVHENREALFLKNFVERGSAGETEPLNLGYTKEQALRDREHKTPANKNPVPSRVPQQGNRYNKPAPR
jgi:hypothetical protein